VSARQFDDVAVLLVPIRARSGLSIADVIAKTGASCSHVRHIFRGSHRPGPAVLATILRAIGATEEEALEITDVAGRIPGGPRLTSQRRPGRPAKPVDTSCSGRCVAHDGRMMPGDGERDDCCRHYARCLAVLAKAHPVAQQSHCPAQCSMRQHPDRGATLNSQSTGLGSWANFPEA